MQKRRSSPLLAIVLGSLCFVSATSQETSETGCDGLPKFVGIGGLCPPQVASFCILEGRSCEAQDAEYVRTRVRTIVGDRKVCGRFLHQDLEHVRFDSDYDLPPGSIETYLFGAPNASALPIFLSPKAAHVDVDNDGAPERIILVRIPGSGSRPCDASRFFQLDQAKYTVDSPMTSLLGGLPGCPGTLPVRLNGNTYFVSRSSIIGNRGTRRQLLWQVYEFRDWSKRKLCEFRYE